ncbi:hypothetical protein HOE425_290057 [Hoeflea sp. EC-HK425]|nr:hypothetical protein HOE425_290057 [Hoeflea sp. EC-HK425]
MDFSSINVKEADGVALKLLALRLVPLDFRQARDAMPLQAAPLGGATLACRAMDAAPIASDAGSTTTGRNNNRPAVTAFGDGTPRLPLLRLRSGPLSEVLSGQSSYPQSSSASAISQRSWG